MDGDERPARFEGEDVFLEVDGERVRGRITTLTRRALGVAIVEPCSRLASDGWLPYFAAGVLAFAGANGELTEHGARAAASLLRELFRACRAYEQAREHLEVGCRRVVADLEAEIARAGGIDEPTFYESRRALRRDLKAGLEPRVYQRRLRALRELRSAAHGTHLDFAPRLADWLLAERGISIRPGYLRNLVLRDELPTPACERCFPRKGA